MATEFLSRTERTQPVREDFGVGASAGNYEPQSSFRAAKPAYVGFGSTSKRSEMAAALATPGAGSYDLDVGLALSSSIAANAFKSKTSRFKTNETQANEVGPASYALKSTLKNGRPKQFPRQSRHLGIEILDALTLKSHPPSIPAKNQCSGYESAPSGQLVLQEPVDPGFSGNKYDAVGPGDYEPKIDVKYRSAPIPSMKGSDRNQLEKMMQKASVAPGPGYYNCHSSFDQYNSEVNADFITQLNAARKRLSASFESKTDRSAMLKDALRGREGQPGPGEYNIASTIPTSPTKPANLQFFTSSQERFKDPLSRSMQTNTAPGAYSIPSDFEAAKIKILRQKKLANRSGWAQNIAFTSTETRFLHIDKKVVPPPGHYMPKNFNISASIEAQNVRAGPFGSKAKRFEGEQQKGRSAFAQTNDEALARELERELGAGVGPGSFHEHQNKDAKHGSSQMHLQRKRQKPTSFQPRFKEQDISNIGPAPGSYNTNPSWSAPGVVPMIMPSGTTSRKAPDPSPGPGDYLLPSTINQVRKSRKDVMISSSKRSGMGTNEKNSAPGPGAYNISKGGLIRQTFNIMLAPE